MAKPRRQGGAVLAVLGALAMAGLVLVRQGSTKSVLLARGGVVARALQAALREEGRVEKVQSEVATLDRIRDGMTAQLRAVAPARPERVLDAVARDSRQLRAKLDQAARAETKLLQQSEALVDGGCKDHHVEQCGGESCCAFWAKKGQCLPTSAHKAWMDVRCSRSCGACSSAQDDLRDEGADGTARRLHDMLHVPAHGIPAGSSQRVHLAAVARAARRRALSKRTGRKVRWHKSGLALPRAGGMQQIDVSMVLHGLDASQLSHAQIEQALRRAAGSLRTAGLSAHAVRIESVQAVAGASTDDRPVHRRRWAHPQRSKVVAYVHGSMPAFGPEEEDKVPTLAGQRPRGRGDSFTPRRRLLADTSIPQPLGAQHMATRVRFRVNVPAGLAGERMVQALRAALREEVHQMLRRENHRSRGHILMPQVTLEHARVSERAAAGAKGAQMVKLKLHKVPPSRFASVLGGKPVRDTETAGQDTHTAAEELGRVRTAASSREGSALGALLSGSWSGVRTASVQSEGRGGDSVEAKSQQPTFAGGVAGRKAAPRETRLGEAGLGGSAIADGSKSADALVGQPLKYGEKSGFNRETSRRLGEPLSERGGAAVRSFIRPTDAPTKREVPWSFAQPVMSALRPAVARTHIAPIPGPTA